MGRKFGAVSLWGRGAGSSSNTMWQLKAEAYLHAKFHLDPYSRLATIDMGRKLGDLPPFGERGAGSQSNRTSLGSRPTFLPSGILIDPSSHLATTDTGQKLGRAVPLWGGDLGPRLTQCGQGRGLPTRQVSSGSVQPFGYSRLHQRYRQDRTDRQTDRVTTVR